MKRFYDMVACADGVVLLNHCPKFKGAPSTVAFDLSSDLEIVGRIRPVTEGGIDVQMRGYEKDGGFTPILIRVWPAGGREWNGAKHARTPRLIDGAHRIEAAKRLGLKTIMALLVERSDDEAKAMEIAANVFRAELTPAEKGRQMIEWCRLHGLPVPGEDDGGALGEGERAAAESDDPQADGSPLADAVKAPEKLKNGFQFSEPLAGAPCQELPASTDDSQPAQLQADAPCQQLPPGDAQRAKPADVPPARACGGRGKKGSTALAAAAFGISKPTVRAYVAAAQAEAAAKEGDTAAQRSENTSGTGITTAERRARAEAAAVLIVGRIDISDRPMLVEALKWVTDIRSAALFVKFLLAQMSPIAAAA
jgi:hypothetical protein